MSASPSSFFPSVQIAATPVVEWQDGRTHRRHDELAVEEPLEIRVKGRPISVTMRTPGHDAELAVGFLLTEGLIARREDVQAFDRLTPEPPEVSELPEFPELSEFPQRAQRQQAPRIPQIPESAQIAGASDPAGCDVDAGQRDLPLPREGNLIDVALRAGVHVDFERLSRHVFAASSCGICGKASIDAIRAQRLVPPARDVRLDPAVLRTLPDVLRAGQTVFGRTGGLHAAGLFDLDGRMLAIREDIGRHNAVDKIIGHALLTGQSLTRAVLLVSGRGGFEIIQKALVAGIPIVAAVSAPSSLAVQLARDLGLTLIGFLRGTRFVVYAGEDRLLAPGASPR